MHQSSSARDIKVTLGSIRHILDDLALKNGNKNQQNNDNVIQTEGQLQLMLKKIRVSKLQQGFIQKINRANIHRQPTKFQILSQRQKDQKRILKFKGLRYDQRILSAIYLLDIIFCLVTFVTGSFRAFIDNFTTTGDQHSDIIIALMIIAIVVTSFKIIANSVTQTIQDGIQLIYLSDICINYFFTFFVYIDAGYVAINIASLALQNDNAGIAAALFVISLIKLFSLYSNLRIFETNFINSFKKQQYFNLLKVGLFNIFFAHFVASVLLAMSKMHDQENWRVYKGINQQPWHVQYLWAFYWACTIIMTVGFGDFLAFTHKQAIVVAFIELFSCIVLAFNISQIGSIIGAIRSSQTQFRKKIAIFKRMAKDDQIDIQLQRKIEAYLKEQKQIKQQFQFNQQNQLLNSIPDNLKNQYIIQSNKQLFPDLPFFKNLQKTTLIRFTQSFVGKVYYPGEYLTRLQQSNDSIMILKYGKVGLGYKKYGSFLNGTIVQQVEVLQKQVVNVQGQFQRKVVPILLNTDFLVQKKKMNYQIIAQMYSFVFHIDYEAFFNVIKQSQIDSSYYYSIKHKHSVIQNQWQQLVCQICSLKEEDSTYQQSYQKDKQTYSTKAIMKLDKVKYHSKFNCPKLHYFPLNGIIVLKSIKHEGEEQQRSESFFRGKKRLHTSLLIRKVFFKKYEEARNLSVSKKHKRFEFLRHQDKEQGQKQWMLFQDKSKEKQEVKEMQARKKQYKEQQQRRDQVLMIEKVVKEAVEQALTGYRPDYWDLQIDEMNNYTNYFPAQNPKSLDLLHLDSNKSNQRKNKFRNALRTRSVLETIRNLQNHNL